ncbi:cardiolipin synthase [Propioniciclava coleopterorum]|uniref:Cardiolipin synthase n=1 Tax=Propioniciclava coleopterorum TaxID=2714937 RepID=A0A6G7Y594_9ACTN|nr:cardiolipin synthase [Propioniciclava coleopterorum]QIK71992.1 cardiolipin synthase [Propioniciclava coleopterorum]
MTPTVILSTIWLVLEYAMKIIAIGVVPENRRPSSSSAWLLLILFLPVVGFPLYWLIGSPWVTGRRQQVQQQADEIIRTHALGLPLIPEGADASQGLDGVIAMNRDLTGLPCMTGEIHGLLADAADTYAAMAEAVDGATRYVHVEFYIMAWDATTDVFFQALAAAVKRGVKVRLLVDQLGSQKYPGWREFGRRLTAIGVEWRLMMPIDLLRGRWRRPDLRNHRKLLVVDGERALVGSHNVIDPSYGSRRNEQIGRRWHDLSVVVSGDIVLEVEAVFAMDWYTESGERLDPAEHFIDKPDLIPGGSVNAMQLVPSGPGYPTQPNHRMFIALMYLAEETITIASPYFVPDESLLTALTSAVYRGVHVELYVGAEADQFVVGHAQRSYYEALLEAGVQIYLYPAPAVLHSKYMTVDDKVGVIGSSNMDYRSFALDYEIMLMAFDGNLVDLLHRNDAHYRQVSTVLTLEEWRQRPWYEKYVNNVCRLTSALM